MKAPQELLDKAFRLGGVNDDSALLFGLRHIRAGLEAIHLPRLIARVAGSRREQDHAGGHAGNEPPKCQCRHARTSLRTRWFSESPM